MRKKWKEEPKKKMNEREKGRNFRCKKANSCLTIRQGACLSSEPSNWTAAYGFHRTKTSIIRLD